MYENVPILLEGSDLAEAMPCADKERGSRPILPSPMGEIEKPC
jgi:hypothetical protein